MDAWIILKTFVLLKMSQNKNVKGTIPKHLTTFSTNGTTCSNKINVILTSSRNRYFFSLLQRGEQFDPQNNREKIWYFRNSSLECASGTVHWLEVFGREQIIPHPHTQIRLIALYNINKTFLSTFFDIHCLCISSSGTNLSLFEQVPPVFLNEPKERFQNLHVFVKR